MNQCCLK